MALPTDISHVDELGCVPQEARWLVGFWMNKGTTMPGTMASAWMRKYGPTQRGVYWSPEVRQRIALQLQHVRHWTVQQKSYEQIPDVRGTWFIDAPYDNEAGEHYKYGRKNIDYEHLGHWCRSRSGQVIVCEGEGATWLNFAQLGTFKGQQKRSEELIWTNDLDRQRLPVGCAPIEQNAAHVSAHVLTSTVFRKISTMRPTSAQYCKS